MRVIKKKTEWIWSKVKLVVLTLGEGGVGGTPPLSEADGGAIVRLPVLGRQDGHCLVCGPSAQERSRRNAGVRAVAWNKFTERGGVLQQAEVAVHGAHVVADVRVHAAHGRVVTKSE